MKIFSSRLSDEDREKNRQKYKAQFESDKQAFEQYRVKVEKELHKLFAPEIAQLPGLIIKFDKLKHKDKYAVMIKYGSSRSRTAKGNVKYYAEDYELLNEGTKRNIHKRGIGFSLFIFTKNNKVVSEPVLRADMLDPDDYLKLRAVYDILTTAQRTDWDAFFKRISDEAPKLSQYDTDWQGQLRDDASDKENDKIDLHNLIGKDVWVPIKLKEGRYHYTYYIRLLGESDSFYKCNILDIMNYSSNISIYCKNRFTRINSVPELEEEMSKVSRIKKDNVILCKDEDDVTLTSQDLIDSLQES